LINARNARSNASLTPRLRGLRSRDCIPRQILVTYARVPGAVRDSRVAGLCVAPRPAQTGDSRTCRACRNPARDAETDHAFIVETMSKKSRMPERGMSRTTVLNDYGEMESAHRWNPGASKRQGAVRSLQNESRSRAAFRATIARSRTTRLAGILPSTTAANRRCRHQVAERTSGTADRSQ